MADSKCAYCEFADELTEPKPNVAAGESWEYDGMMYNLERRRDGWMVVCDNEFRKVCSIRVCVPVKCCPMCGRGLREVD